MEDYRKFLSVDNGHGILIPKKYIYLLENYYTSPILIFDKNRGVLLKILLLIIYLNLFKKMNSYSLKLF